MAIVTGTVKPIPAPPARANTNTMASGPYDTEAIASSDRPASPVATESFCFSGSPPARMVDDMTPRCPSITACLTESVSSFPVALRLILTML